MTERRYPIVIEGDANSNFSAYPPDLPGRVATGATRADVTRDMRDAITAHLDGLPVSRSICSTPANANVGAVGTQN